MPGAELAEAFVRLRADSSAIKKDVEAGMKGADGTAAGTSAGKQYGSGFSSSAASEIKKNAGKIALAGTAAIAVVGVASIKMAGDFQAGMNRLVTSAGETKKNLDLVSKGVLQIAVATGTSTEQLSQGLYTVESAGYHGAAGLNVLKAAAQGARAENAQLATVTDAVTTVLNDYHLKASDATRVTSALVATVASGKTTMELLSGSLSRVLPTAAALHVAFPQIASDIAVLTAHGVSARLATQDLNSVLVALSAPSNKAAGVMKEVGLSANQVSNAIGKQGLTATLTELSNAFLKNAGPDGELLLATLKGLPGPAQAAANAFLAGSISTKQLGKATADLTPLQQDQVKQFIKISSSATGLKENYVAAMTAMLGGTRGLGVALQLTGANAKTAADDAKTIGGAFTSAGKNVAGWDVIQQSFNFKLSQFREEAETTAISLGTKLLPAATAAIGFFASHEAVLTDTAGGLLAVVGSITALAIAIKGVQVISTVYNGITGAAKALKLFSDQAVATAINAKIGAAGIGAMDASMAGTEAAAAGAAGGLEGLSLAEKSAAVAGAALDAVNPLGWATIAVAAAVALGAALSQIRGQVDGLVASEQKADNATGFNVAGWQKFSTQLQTGAASQQVAKNAVDATSTSLTKQKLLLALDPAGWATANVTAAHDVSAAQALAASRATNLAGVLGFMANDWHLNAAEAAKFATQAGVTASALGQSGTAGDNATLSLVQFANTARGQAALGADQLATKVQAANTALAALQTGLLASQGGLLGWQSAQQQATSQLAQTGNAIKGNSAAAISNRGAILQATNAAITYADQQAQVKGNVGVAVSALQQQVTWLKQNGQGSQFAAQEIQALETVIAKLTSKQIAITVKGSGSYTVVGTEAATGKAGSGTEPGRFFQKTAEGWYVRGGTPGKDSVPILAMPGELVVPTHLVRGGAVDHLRGKIPGFAAGGIVPAYSGSPGAPEGTWITNDANGTATLLEQATAQAAAAAIKTIQQATFAGGPGGGQPAANAALARQLMPSWGSGGEWVAWNSVAMRESGWNQYARNPSSGAYGIPQALPASKMGAAANPPQSNASAQIKWMISYIQGRYGTPEAAWSHEQSVGWYASGTPSAAPGWAVTGEHGPELVRMRGGETVLPAGMTSRVLSAVLPGMATGGPVKKPTPAQALKTKRLAELAADVVQVGKLNKARNAQMLSRGDAVVAEELYVLQHAGDKAAPKKLKAMQAAFSRWKAASLPPITRLDNEINLLRVLTGHPAGAKYAGPPPPAADTSGTTDTSDDTSAADSSAAASTPPPAALPLPTFAVAAGGGGFIGGGAASAVPGVTGAPVAAVYGGPGAVPAAVMPSGPSDDSDVGAQFAALRQQMAQLIQVSATAPMRAAGRFGDVMTGVGRGARQRAAYSHVTGV